MPTKTQTPVVKIVKKALPSVVSITMTKNLAGLESIFKLSGQTQSKTPKRNRMKMGGGSGFIVTSDGIVLTNRHVMEEPKADYALVLHNGEKVKPKILGIDNIKTIWSNLEKYQATKINNDAVDYALLINVLFQNNNHLNILKEAVRITRRGGKILIVDWNEGRFQIGPRPEDKLGISEIMAIAATLNS